MVRVHPEFLAKQRLPADVADGDTWEPRFQEINNFELMLNHTSTELAPWFAIPADHKWFARLAVSEAICTTLEGIDLRSPEVSPQRRAWNCRRSVKHLKTNDKPPLRRPKTHV